MANLCAKHFCCPFHAYLLIMKPLTPLFPPYSPSVFQVILIFQAMNQLREQPRKQHYQHYSNLYHQHHPLRISSQVIKRRFFAVNQFINQLLKYIDTVRLFSFRNKLLNETTTYSLLDYVLTIIIPSINSFINLIQLTINSNYYSRNKILCTAN